MLRVCRYTKLSSNASTPRSSLWISFWRQPNEGSVLGIFLFLVTNWRVRSVVLSGRLRGRLRIKISVSSCVELNLLNKKGPNDILKHWSFSITTLCSYIITDNKFTVEHLNYFTRSESCIAAYKKKLALGCTWTISTQYSETSKENRQNNHKDLQHREAW